VYDRLKEFKDSRKLKSDSQAIATILSEFLEVSQQVAHESSLDLVQRIEALEAKFIHVKDELLNELKGELLRLIPFSIDERLTKLEVNLDTVHQTQAKVKHELLSELKSESVDNQLKLLDENKPDLPKKPSPVASESLSELSSGRC